MDYQVVGPGEKVVLDGTKERQGDFVFTAQSIGEYRFCFNNEMSTFAEKLVDFEIAVCWDPRLHHYLLFLRHWNNIDWFFNPTRSKTKNVRNSLPDRVPAPSRPPRSRSPSTSFLPSFRPFLETRNTSGPERTVTLALFVALNVGSSILASLRA